MLTIIILSGIILLLCIVVIILISATNKSRNQLALQSVEKVTAQTRADEASKQITDLLEKQSDAQTTITSLREENSRIQERIRFIEEEKERLEKESETRFKNIANELLSDNSRKFKEQNEERLSEILNPLKENIEQFKKTIAESYSNEARERFSLQERIKELIELNQSIGKEAKELSSALKGNSKVQGDWGELILESILEKSGLERGREFFVQKSTRDEKGNLLRADVVINYPDGRCMVIDSKVSLTAYVNYVNAETTEAQEQCKKQHINSVRNHIAELRTKKYQDYLGEKKADFVLMFIPNEAAYIAAMQMDNNLWQDAYDSRVLIISPTHLISVLRLVEQLWLHDRQTRNAIEIADESGKLVDKFVGFIEDMNKIDKSLSQTRESYDKAMNKLYIGTGNLVGRANKLKEMGAKATKAIPSLPSSPAKLK